MKKLRAGLVALLVAFLTSITLAVPASAVDPVDWWAQNAKTGTQYHSGFDYYKPITGGTPVGPASTYPKPTVPVNGTINPSGSGGTYTGPAGNTVVRAPLTSNTPLTGRIIQPGTSLVRVPSTYAPITGLATGVELGLSRLWPGIGLGIGSTSLPPGNWKELSLAQGVPQTCIDNVKTCDRASIDKMFAITNCGTTGNCAAIGAVGETGETDPQKWFKQDALPFLDNLWCIITASCPNKEPVDGHNTATLNKGCYTEYGVELRADNNITFHKRTTTVTARPTDTVQQVYYDQYCDAAAQADQSKTSQTSYEVTCVDAAGHTGTSNGSPFGVTNQIGSSFWNADGTNKTALCGGNVSSQVQPTKIARIRVWSNGDPALYTQAYYNALGSGRYSKVKYSEWVNPDASVNAVDDTKITTNWDCTDVLGKVWSFSKAITGTAAAVSPDCPAGSNLTRHDVKASLPGQQSQTVDAGAQNNTEMAKYPNCSGTGCTIDIWVDGSRCVVGRVECATWPSVNAIQPSRVKCMWGSYTVPTSDCYAIANGYKSETGVIYDPISGTWVAPDAYGNPVASNPEPWNQNNPQPQPGVKPGTSTGTGTGTGTGTITGPVPIPTGEGANCWPGGTAAFNPLEWVLAPVKCALQWAFVPQQTVAQTQMTRIQNSFGKVGVVGAIGTVGTSISTVGGAAGSGGGCTGPTFHFDFDAVHQELQPFNACAEPVATMAAISNAFTTVVVIVMGILGVVRALGSSVGFNFTMGRGGGS